MTVSSSSRVAAGALIVIAVSLVIGEITGWPILRQPLARELAQQTGAPVTIGEPFRLRLIWNPKLETSKLVIGSSEPFASRQLLDAEQVVLRWSWLDIWRWHRGAGLVLRELRTTTLEANLLRLADGRANWALDSSEPWPRIGALAVSDGRINIEDAVDGTALDIRIHGSETGAEAPSAKANHYQATAKGRLAKLPLDLRVESGGLLPLLGDEADGKANGVPLRVEGTVGRARIDFDGSASALLGATRLEGDVKLHAQSMASVGDVLGMTLPATPPFDLSGHLRHAGAIWQLGDTHATVGHSKLGGSFSYETDAKPPKLTGRLTGSRLRFADLGPAVGAPVAAAPAADAVAEPQRVLPQRRFDLPSLSAMDADLQVSIDELDFGVASLRPLQALHSHLVLVDGVLRLQDLHAGVGGGTIRGGTGFDGTGKTARWTAKLDFDGLQVSKWIQGLRKQPPAPPQTAAKGQSHPDAAMAAASPPSPAASAPAGSSTAYLSGEMDGMLDVRGSGRSTAEILASLDGEAQIRLRHGEVSHLVTELAGLDVAQALGVALKGDDPLKIDCARIDATVRNGVVVPRVAVLDNKDSTLRIQGQVDLRDETLDLRSVAHPKDVSPLSLRSPVLVKGTLSDPRVEIDGKPLALRVLAAVALGVLATPAAALLPLIDTGAPEQGDPCAAGSAAPSASAFSGATAATAASAASVPR